MAYLVPGTRYIDYDIPGTRYIIDTYVLLLLYSSISASCCSCVTINRARISLVINNMIEESALAMVALGVDGYYQYN